MMCILQSTVELIFQFIEALGALATFGAFLLLFRRDKEKEQQINKLASIAENIELQNAIMKEANKLISQQVDILNRESLGKISNVEAANKLADIEEKKLKLSLLPRLYIVGTTTKGYLGELDISLSNKGGTATITEIKTLSRSISLYNYNPPYVLEKGETLKIFLKVVPRTTIQDATNISNLEYMLDIFYLDEVGNRYKGIVSGKGGSCKIVETAEL